MSMSTMSIPSSIFPPEPAAPKSPVILVCVQSILPNDVNIDFLYSVFSQFGVVKKILIFERLQTIKVFIEMDGPDTVEKTIKGMETYKNPFHRMVCYRSSLDHVKLKNENASCAKDFTRPQRRNTTTSLTSVDENSARGRNSIEFDSKFSLKEEDSLSPPEEELRRTLSCLSVNDDPAQPEKDFTFYATNFAPPPLVKSQSARPFHSQGSMNNLMTEPSPIGIESQKSPVLYVKGFNPMTTRSNHIYNLFSNFGNIVMMLYFLDAKSALIEYESEEEAAIAMNYIRDLKIQGNKLQVNYSLYKTIKYKTKPRNALVFWGSPKSSKAKGGAYGERFNPPSDTLYIGNLVQEAANEKLIELFLEYGTVEKFQFYHEPPHKNMCLLKFSSVDEAVNAMIGLHGINLFGRNLLISFTRLRI